MDGEIGTKGESVDDRLAGFLDRLVAVRLDLRPVCHERTDLPPEVRQTMTETCEVLHNVISDLVEMLKDKQPPIAYHSNRIRRDGTSN